jgi:glutaredoxin
MKAIQLKTVGAVSLVVLSLNHAPVYAQDWSGVVRGILQGKQNTNSVIGVIKSAVDVSLGQITTGAEAPSDAGGKVVLYETPWCGYCKRAADYMRKNNIAFLQRDIEANPSFRAEYTRLGGRGPVPFIVMGTKTMTGFNETQFSRNYAEFQQGQETAKGSAEGPAPAVATAATTLLQPGDAITGKIAGVPVRAQPSKASNSMLTLGKGDEVIYMGEEQDGFYRVTSSKGEGWVDKLLVRRP